jgi:hypothetical protein
MPFESFTNFTQDTAVGNTWTDAGEITATPREIINVMIGADNEHGSVVTDAAEVRVLVARDDTPTNYTNEPVFIRTFRPTSVSQEWFAFSLYGYKHYKVQWRSAGATDTYTFNGTYRGDGVSA